MSIEDDREDILATLNEDFKNSKADQISRFLQDQQQLNVKFAACSISDTRDEFGSSGSDVSLAETERQLKQRLALHQYGPNRPKTSQGFRNEDLDNNCNVVGNVKGSYIHVDTLSNTKYRPGNTRKRIVSRGNDTNVGQSRNLSNFEQGTLEIGGNSRLQTNGELNGDSINLSLSNFHENEMESMQRHTGHDVYRYQGEQHHQADERRCYDSSDDVMRGHHALTSHIPHKTLNTRNKKMNYDNSEIGMRPYQERRAVGSHSYATEPSNNIDMPQNYTVRSHYADRPFTSVGLRQRSRDTKRKISKSDLVRDNNDNTHGFSGGYQRENSRNMPVMKLPPLDRGVAKTVVGRSIMSSLN